MKRSKILAGIVSILAGALVFTGLLSNVSLAEVSGATIFKIVNGVISPVISTWTLGSSGNRIAGGYFTDINSTTGTIGTLTLSGATSGDLTVGGVIKAGSIPTTLTDTTGKILSAALNTVAVVNGGTGTSTGAMTLVPGATRTIQIDQNATTVGDQLTIVAGRALSGGTNLAGGTLVLSGGIGTGSAGSYISFQISKAGASGTADNAVFQAVTIDGSGTSHHPRGTAAGDTGEIRFLELAANGTNYAGFKSADSLAGNVIWTLPNVDGSTNQFLKTDGAKNLSWGGAAGDMVLADVQTVTGAKTFGTIGGAVGKLILAGSTSGSSILNASAIAGTTTITLPATSGTLVLTDVTTLSSLSSIGTITTGVWNGTDVAVADGGTGLSVGTSGGVLGYTAAGTLASSVALTANALVLGGGAGATPTPMGSLGTTTTVLHGNAAGAPTFAAVSLTADVSGILPTANGGTGIAFFTAAGPTVARVYTFPDAATTILTTNAAVTVAQGGTGAVTLGDAGVLIGNGTGAVQVTGAGTSGQVLTSNGAGVDPTFQAAGGGSKFGGTGADGALTVSIDQNIDAAGANYVVKNYSSLIIDATKTLGLINAHANGTLLHIKVTGDVTINGKIDLKGDGSGAGSGGTGAGGAGTQPDLAWSSVFGGGGSAPTNNAGPGGGGGGSKVAGTTGGAGGGTPGTGGSALSTYQWFTQSGIKIIGATVGAGGGAGGAGDWSGEKGVGGSGGTGGGGIIIEVGGNLTFGASSIIDISGNNGSNGGNATRGGGGGGGGSSGIGYILYNGTLTNSGLTSTVSGGSGGSPGTGGSPGSGGGGGSGEILIKKNTEF